MNIKVCEIKSVEQLFQLNKLEIEYVGLVFDKSSIHYIRNFIQAADITSAEIEILKVGVFVNSPAEEIFKTIEEFDLDLIQLNGNESPQFCKIISNKIEVIKSFQIEDFNKASIENKIKDFDDVCDYYLFQRNHNVLSNAATINIDLKIFNDISFEKPFFIGGGLIKLRDASFLHKFKHPDFFGVNFDENFEKDPKMNDFAMISSFIQTVNQVDN
jgi:phosphoribosylanthranilate isomerase